ncbi:uncharacterized protein DUF998 [Kribbella sp. VKM Ac-2527]|uniref:Uncharacterized protein DUF998 n=1 Tax=Kribbella caucasensis TaxID=2512215 RepID=A0A4R6J6D5_9ACTN|nr:DUF998 domain-containing protein [Kribbella sp. VKM Ac-2527]TDO31002.1 uncharacterized protein DUF998 [Kribbella sp. VKM Ac-2527]
MSGITALTNDRSVPAGRLSNRTLLTFAALAGPGFFASASAQMLTRDGFDLRVHPISQLSTGDLGWIQIATFVLTGLGVIAFAVAHHRLVRVGVGRRLVPIFVAIFGVGLIVSGLFVMDPQNGFPVGTPDGPVPAMSWHSIVHAAAAAVAFTAMAAACVVLVVRAIRCREVAAAIGNGLVGVFLLLPMSPNHASLQIAFTGVVAFTWTTIHALKLRRTT